MSILGTTEAILSLQDGEVWRFSVKGDCTDAESFSKNVVWEGDALTDWTAVNNKMADAKAVVAFRDLRAKRDELLTETDWWASSDRTMTDAETAYRKALRDLPSTLDKTTVLNEITWPTKSE
jgi:hypothetical protein